ncbi:MAG: Ig-like domain-containing protein [Aquabacterium sp.]
MSKVVSTYDERGNRTSFSDEESASGAATRMTYDGRFNVVTSVTDELLRTTKYQIDAKGNIEKVTNADGSEWAYTYYPQGMVRTATDPEGHQTAYFYDAKGRLERVRNPDASFRSYTYDAAGNVKTSTDEEGRTTSFEYDAMNRLVRTIQPAALINGQLTKPEQSFTYDAAGNQTSATDANGHTVISTYDRRGQLTSRKAADGGTTTWHYNSQGEMDWMEDPLGHRTTYTYDLRYRVLTVKDAENNVTEYEYHHGERPEVVKDAEGHETHYEYDARGRLIEKTDALGKQLINVYDAANNLVATTDERGHTTLYHYDAMNRRIGVTDAEGKESKTDYDVLGNVIADTDANGHTTHYTYDARKRLITTKDPYGRITRNEYDKVGNRIAAIDELNRRTEYKYDALDRLVQITLPDPDGDTGSAGPSITKMAYDAVGNRIQVIDALNHATSYEYDAVNRRVKETNAKNASATTQYDEAGNVIATTDFLGRKTTYVYDKINRLTETHMPDPDVAGASTTVAKRTYDKVGNLLSYTDPLNRVTSYVYDELNRAIKMTDAENGVSETEYDEVGNVKARTDAEGRRTTYTYDKVNRLTKVTEPAPGGTGGNEPAITQYEYDDVGNRTRTIDAMGYATRYVYDKLDRLVSTTNALNKTATRTFNEVGDMVASTDELGRVTGFAYDVQHRLIKVTLPDPDGTGGSGSPTITYEYDAVGNQIQATDEIGAVTRTQYDELNRRIGWTDALNHSGSVTYDAVGNVLTQTDELGRTTTFTYDHLNRRLSVTGPDPDGSGTQSAPVATFTYDKVGNLLSKKDARGNTESYTYDKLNRQTETEDADHHKTKAVYDKVGNLIERTDKRGNTTTFSYDKLNRRVSMTEPDPDGAGSSAATAQQPPVTLYSYDLVGNLLSVTDPRGHSTRYTYDKLHRQTSVTDALQHTSSVTYDDVGNVIEETDALGRKTVHTYDDLDRRTRTEQPDADGTGAPVWTYTYDAAGNRTGITDPRNHTTSFVYDKLRRLTSTTDALMHTSTTEYDAVGNVIARTDRLGNQTTFVYDALNRLTERHEADPDGTDGAQGSHTAPVTRFQYDANGNLVRMTDALGKSTQYAYDKLDRRIEVIDALGRSSTLRYDEADNVVRTTDALGRVTTYTYDALNRLISTTLPDPDGSTGTQAAPTLSFGYDAASNRTSTIDAMGYETKVEYDELNRVWRETDALNHTRTTRYDEVGNVIETLDELGRKTSYAYDKLNRLITLTQPDPDGAEGAQTAPVSHFTYDKVGNRLTTTDPMNGVTTQVYDELNRVTSVTDALDHTSRVSYDAEGNVLTSTDALGYVTEYGYDHLNRRIRITQPDPDGTGEQTAPVTTLGYDAVGNLVSRTDALQHTTRYEFDALRRNTKITDALNGETLMGYDAVGNLTSRTDALGRVTTYVYDDLNRRITTIDPDSDGDGERQAPITRFAYDLNGNLLSTTDALKRVTSHSYDKLNRRLSTTNALLQTNSVTYDHVGNVLTETDALGRVTEHSYDDLNRRTLTTLPDPDGSGEQTRPVIRMSYDAVGNVLSITDPLNHTTTYSYDKLSQRIGTTDALNHTATMAYDAMGRLTRSTDVLGRTTLNQYDGLGRLVKVTHPDPDGAEGSQASPVTQMRYDAAGNLLATTDAEGRVTRYAYDALNRRTQLIDALDKVTTSTYDKVGNLLTVTDPLQRTTTYAYDALDRRISVTQPDPDGTAGPMQALVTRFDHDAVGNLVKVTDPLLHESFKVYDALNRVKTEIDAEGHGTAYEYDEVGKLKSVTDPDNNTTRYEYDRLDRLVKQTDALNAVRSFAYDAAGNRIRKTDALGRVTDYGFDALNRQTTETWLGTTGSTERVITRVYDEAGQLTRISDADSVYAMTYDGMGRVTRVDNSGTPGAVQAAFDYRYDAVGNVLRVQATINGNASWHTESTYDKLNRVKTMVQDGGPAVFKRAEFDYDDAGQLTATRRFDANGTAADIRTAITWDQAGRISSLQHSNASGTVANYQYTWNEATLLSHLVSTDGTADFVYDKAGQLNRADFSYQDDQVFNLDGNGNPATGTSTNNQVTDDSLYTYTYDAEGNRATRTEKATGQVTTYTWDHHNRLTSATTRNAGGQVIATETVRYDAFDRKIETVTDADGAGTQGAVTQRYVHEGDDVAMVYDGNGQMQDLYLHAPGMDQLIAEQHGNQLRWTLADHQQTVRDVTDASGNLLNHLRYDSFGRLTAQTNAAVATRYTYTGREYDAVLDLMDYRARWYDARMGRFVSTDPMGFGAGDANLYRYVGNNPFGATDPTGMTELQTNSTAVKWAARGVGAIAAVPGFVFEMGYSVGTFIDRNVINPLFWQSAAQREAAIRQRAEQRMKDAFDPCGDLLHAINSLPGTFDRMYNAAAEAYYKWDKEVDDLAASGSVWNNVKAGYKFTEPVIEVALNVLPPVIGVAGAVVELASVGRALEAESFAMRVLKETRRDLGMGGLRSDNAVAHFRQYGMDYTDRKALMHTLQLQAKAEGKAGEWIGRYRELENLRRTNYDAWAERIGKIDIRVGAQEVREQLMLKRYEQALKTNPRTAHKVLESQGSILDTMDNAVNSWVKQKKAALLEEAGGVGSFAAGESDRVILASESRIYNLDFEIRSGDRWTSAVSRWGDEMGLAAKPENYKGKTYFGIAPKTPGVKGLVEAGVRAIWEVPTQGVQGWLRNNFYRGDLDIYRITQRMPDGTIRQLNNREVLDVIDRMNNRKVFEFGGTPSFNHGAHATMHMTEGGYLNFTSSPIGKGVQMDKIGAPGAITAVRAERSGLVVTEMSEAQVYNRAMQPGSGENWYGIWDQPKGSAFRNTPAAAAPVAREAAVNAAAALQGTGANASMGALEKSVLRIEQSPVRLRTPALQAAQADLHAITNQEIEALLGGLGSGGARSGTMFQMPGQNPISGSGLQDILTKVNHDPNQITYNVNHYFSGVTSARINGAAAGGIPQTLVMSGPLEADALMASELTTNAAGNWLGLGNVEVRYHSTNPRFPVYGPTVQVNTPSQRFGFLGNKKLWVDAPQAQYLHPGGNWLDLSNQALTPQMRTDVHWPTGGGALTAGHTSGTVTLPAATRLQDTSASLQLADLATLLWNQLRPAGMAAADLALRIEIADLPDGELGHAYITQLNAAGLPSEGKIVLDIDADGHGWFVDATPLDAGEFAPQLGTGSATQSWSALPGSSAQGRYDLFTVLAHEVGHTLGILQGFAGFDARVSTAADGTRLFHAQGISVMLSADGAHFSDADHADDLMADSLALSQRKLPSLLDAQVLAAVRGATLPSTGVAMPVNIGPGLVTVSATPVPLRNGDFALSTPGADFGWQATGSATVANGQGVLQEDVSLTSRLRQDFTVAQGASKLSFKITEAMFGTLGSGPRDAFEVALLDPSTHTPLAGAIDLQGTDALLNIQADGTVLSAASVSITGLVNGKLPTQWSSPLIVTIDLAGLQAGTEMALYFDLLGFGALGSRVAIDDVRFGEQSAPQNHAPVAHDDAVTTEEDTAIVFDPRGNDTDADGDPLQIVIVQGPAHGTVVRNLDGTLRYTPVANFHGSDSFTYLLNDGQADSNVATVTIDVTPVNDAPTLNPPVQGPLNVQEGALITLPLSSIDIDTGDTVHYVLDQAPAGATITAGGMLQWRATDGNAAYSFTLRAVDQAGASSAAQSFTVNVANVAPTLTLGAPSSAEVGKPVTISLGHTDPGQDTLINWRIDWGDGKVEVLSGTVTTASHVYTSAAAQRTVQVQASDEDGTWTGPSRTLKVVAASDPNTDPNQGGGGKDPNQGDPNTLPGGLPGGGSTGAGGGRPDPNNPRGTSGDPNRPGSSTVVTRPGSGLPGSVSGDPNGSTSGGLRLPVITGTLSAHPMVQARGVARIESAPADRVPSHVVMTADALNQLIERNPTGAGARSSLQVTGVTVGATGLHVRFTEAIDGRRLHGELFSQFKHGNGPAVVLMRGKATIAGHIVIDADGEGFVFIADKGLLPDGEYTLMLRAAWDGVVDQRGLLLDGDYDGKPGGHFRARFIVSEGGQRISLLPASGDTRTASADEGRSVTTGDATGTGAGLVSLLYAAMQPAVRRPAVRRPLRTRHVSRLAHGLPPEAGGLAASRRHAMAEVPPPVVHMAADPATQAPAFPLQHGAPGWVARWVGVEDEAPPSWQIRL